MDNYIVYINPKRYPNIEMPDRAVTKNIHPGPPKKNRPK